MIINVKWVLLQPLQCEPVEGSVKSFTVQPFTYSMGRFGLFKRRFHKQVKNNNLGLSVYTSFY